MFCVVLSFHRYMAEHHSSSEDDIPTKKPTRGATRMRKLLIKRAKGEKTPVDIDVNTGVASGPNGDIFKTYLGMLARERISILTPSFDHVQEVDRNMIWQDIQVNNFNVIEFTI